MTSLRRRRLLGTALVLPLLPNSAFPQSAPLTPACGGQTARQTEGPFFSPDSPERTSLIEKRSAKDKLVLAGQVLSAQCKPVPGAIVDFWHADESGEYDNRGFRYRGHQRTDAQGRYRLETIVPGEYPGRTRHVHVKVQPPGRRVLTTQLYFPNDPGNRRDGLYRPELEIRTDKAGQGAFDFVVEA
jgi:protocatechuate 3,4-dioxygenase beta subunit